MHLIISIKVYTRVASPFRPCRVAVTHWAVWYVLFSIPSPCSIWLRSSLIDTITSNSCMDFLNCYVTMVVHVVWPHIFVLKSLENIALFWKVPKEHTGVFIFFPFLRLKNLKGLIQEIKWNETRLEPPVLGRTLFPFAFLFLIRCFHLLSGEQGNDSITDLPIDFAHIWC